MLLNHTILNEKLLLATLAIFLRPSTKSTSHNTKALTLIFYITLNGGDDGYIVHQMSLFPLRMILWSPYKE